MLAEAEVSGNPRVVAPNDQVLSVQTSERDMGACDTGPRIGETSKRSMSISVYWKMNERYRQSTDVTYVCYLFVCYTLFKFIRQ